MLRRFLMYAWCFIPSLALPLFASHDDPRARYRVLLPHYATQPLEGAFGSRWRTTLSMYNPTSVEVFIDWCSFSTAPGFGVCTAIGDPRARLDARETQTDVLPDFDPGPAPNDAAPRLLYLRTNPAHALASAAQVEFALRAFDTSRSATNAGTEIPVVRQEQFRKTPIHLLNVPVDPAFRLTLRLYELHLKIAGFTIRIRDQATGALLGERDVVLAFPLESHWISMFEPPNAQIGDLTSFVPTGTTLPSRLRIEIVPRSEGSEFWAFVSITNNDTQHLTLVTPQ